MREVREYIVDKFDYVVLHVSKERPGVEAGYKKNSFKFMKEYEVKESGEKLNVMIYKPDYKLKK
jgi:hypothetical protein